MKESVLKDLVQVKCTLYNYNAPESLVNCYSILVHTHTHTLTDNPSADGISFHLKRGKVISTESSLCTVYWKEAGKKTCQHVYTYTLKFSNRFFVVDDINQFILFKVKLQYGDYIWLTYECNKTWFLQRVWSYCRKKDLIFLEVFKLQ